MGGLVFAAALHGAVPGQSDAGSAIAEARLPRSIASFGAAALDGWAYVYGGHVGRAHAHTMENQVGDFYRIRLEPAVEVETLPSGPPLQGLALVACRGRVCRIGGMRARNAPGHPPDLHSSEECASYDPRGKSWSPLPPLPEPRSSHDAAVLDGAIYVVGGWTLRGTERTWCTTALCLDLAAAQPRWRPIAAPPFQRRAGALVAHASRLYFLGGIEPNDGISERVDTYDVQGDRWLPGPRLRGHGFGLAACADSVSMLTSGGDGISYRFDGERFEPAGSLLVPRFFHRLLQLDGRLLALGGETKSGHTAVIEAIELRPDVPLVLTWHTTLPTRARNRQGMVLEDQSLQLFGGNNSAEQHAFAEDDFSRESCAVDLLTMTASSRPDFPVARQSLVTVRIEGDAPHWLALGGFGHDGTAARSHHEVFRYSSESEQWARTEVALDVPRTQFGAVAHGGTVHVLGGTDYDARRDAATSFRFPLDVFSFSSALDAPVEPRGWKIPRARRAFGGAKIGSLYYLVGGMESDFRPVHECDVLDLATGQWSTFPGPPTHRVAPALVALEGALYLAGGSPDAPAVERFDPATQRWSTVVKKLPSPSRHLRMFTHRGRLLLASPSEGESPGLHLTLIQVPLHAEPRALEANARRER